MQSRVLRFGWSEWGVTGGLDFLCFNRPTVRHIKVRLLAMSIGKLNALVPPPVRPSEAGSLEQWRVVEQRLGLALPSDYREFIFAYGTGRFAQFYRVYNPFSASEWMSLFPSVDRVCKAAREIKRDWPEDVPYPIYPERPGLLPWANDENGNDYYWLTDGPPDTWQVYSDEVRAEGFRQYGRCMTDFLCEVLTGKIQALAGDYPRDSHRVFETWSV
jgi:hypothetical protein